ncbi:MAG: hypothetical protein RLY61_278 [Candidatus Parcubacteria bacterium]
MPSSKILALLGPYVDNTGKLVKDLPSEVVRALVKEYVFETDTALKQQAKNTIWDLCLQKNIFPSSINDIYMKRAHNQLPHTFTVPAFNIRGITFDIAKEIFAVAKETDTSYFIFELSRSEMGYTGQDCEEYATCVLGAALAANYVGPVYLQGDHFQTKPIAEGVIEDGEVEKLKLLIDKALQNGFYNIDIDASTLVNLSAPTLEEQQRENIKYTLELAKYIRENQPDGIEVSIGGEIGHIGGKNSTLKELDTFLTGFYAQWDKGIPGLSKVSIQSGTSHGGTVLATGKVHPAEVDFGLLENAGDFVRSKFKVGGVVQHGASTQPHDFFSQLPQHKVLEVHLATGLQNAVFDSQNFPPALKKEMYAWIKLEKKSECKEDWNEDQFMYKLRKKCWGTFKKELWDASLDLGDLNSLLLGYFSALKIIEK